jgi:hypothetical protein
VRIYEKKPLGYTLVAEVQMPSTTALITGAGAMQHEYVARSWNGTKESPDSVSVIVPVPVPTLIPLPPTGLKVIAVVMGVDR